MYHSKLSLDLQTLFMLSMIIKWITVPIYLDFSHVSINLLFMLGSNKLNVWFWDFIVYVKHVDYYYKFFNCSHVKYVEYYCELFRL